LLSSSLSKKFYLAQII